MDEILALFQAASTSSTNEDLGHVTEQIAQLKNNLDYYPVILQIIANKSINSLVRKQAAICIKSMSMIHSHNIVADPNLPNIKQLFLETIRNEEDVVLRNLLYVSIEEIVKKAQWPELFQYSLDCAGMGTPAGFHIATNILSIALFHINPQELSPMTQTINDLIIGALQFNDIELIKSAAKLFANTICHLEEQFPETLQPSLDALLQILSANLPNSSNVAQIITDALENSVQESGVMNPIELTQVLLNMINEQINPINVYHIFVPISKCIGFFPMDLRELLPTIIGSMIKFSDLQFDTNLSAVEQNDFGDIFAIILQDINATKLWNMVQPLLVYQGEGSAFTILKFLEQLMIADPVVASNKTTFIMEFILGLLNNDTVCFAIRQVGFEVLSSFINDSNHTLDFYSEAIYTVIDANLGVEGLTVDVHRAIVDCLMHSMQELPTPAEYYQRIWEIITGTYEVEELRSQAVECLSYFITLAGKENLADSYENILEILGDALEQDPRADPYIRTNAIIALGNLLSIDSSLLQNGDLTEKIIMAAQSEDFDLQCASVAALSAMISPSAPAVTELIPLALELVHTIINGEAIQKMFEGAEQTDENEFEENEEIGGKFNDACQTLCQCFTLLKSIVSYFPDSLDEEHRQHFMDILTYYISVNNDKRLTQYALEAALEMTTKYQLDANELLENSSLLCGAADTSDAGLFFYAADLLMNANMVNPEFILRENDTGLLYNALIALKHKLPSQSFGKGDDNEDDGGEEIQEGEAPKEEDMFDTKLMPNVYKFVCDCIEKFPDNINPTDIVQACKTCTKSDSNEESACSQVLATLFKHCHDKMHAIARNEAIKLVCNAFNGIDGNSAPHILVTARTIVGANPQLLERYLSDLYNAALEFSLSDNMGQAFYFQTRTASLAFIVSLVHANMVNLEEALPVIANAMPLVVGFADCANVVYGFLLNTYNRADDETKQKIVNAFVQVAQMNEREKAKLLISDEIYSNIIQIYRQVVPQ